MAWYYSIQSNIQDYQVKRTTTHYIQLHLNGDKQKKQFYAQLNGILLDQTDQSWLVDTVILDNTGKQSIIV